jgi:hypothetical protein
VSERRRGPADPWQAPLLRAIVLRDGTRLDTLHEARAYMIALPEDHQHRNAWQKAAELLMVAAANRDGIPAANKQLELALFIEGKWVLPK